MNGKTAKAVMRIARKQSAVLFVTGFNHVCDRPLRDRLRFALRIVTGKGFQR
jgi:hypothetical protein